MIRSAVIFIILSVLIVGCSAKMDPEGYYRVAPVDDPFMLPYKFTIWKKKVGQGTARNLILQQYVPVDIYGSGTTGMYLIGDNWRPADSLTAILFYADTEEKKTLSQINVNTTHIASHFPYDFNGDNVIEVAVTYTTRDTLWLDIIDPHQRRIYRRPLVVGRDRDGNGFWDGSGTFCGVHDFNDDGYVELLVNCDVGYDLYPRKLMCVDWFNNKIVWEYEIAGIINSEHTYVEPLAPGNKPSIVFGVGSKGNAAKTGDMDDQHSYLIVLDENGKLQWKKETGGVFSSCVPVLLDYDNDGATDVLTTCRYKAPGTTGEADMENGGMFKIYDMYGGVLDSIDYGVGKIISSVRLLDFDSDGLRELFVSLSDASIIIYDQRLRPVRKAKFYTAAGVWDCRDFLGVGNNQLLVASRDNKLWLLDKGFKPLAQFGEGEDLHYRKSAVYKARESQEGFDLIVAGNAGQVNYFLSLVKSPWNTVFFRYPLLAFLAALLPMSLVVALIWFNWHRTRKQKRIISQQRDRLNTALEDLQAAQEKLIAIEEYNKAQDALRESEERFRNLTEYIPGVSIQGYRPDGTVVYWNKASEEIYGYTAREAIGKNLGELIVPPDILPRFEKALEIGEKAKKSGEFMPPGELMLLHKKGHLVPVYSIHTAVYVEGKEPLLFCIDVDLSERKKTEEALRERLRYEKALAYCSQQLVEVPDLHEAMQRVIENLLSVVGISRVYIFENFEDPQEGTCMRQIYEAAAEGTEPQIDNPVLQRLPYKEASKNLLDKLTAGEVYGGIVRELPEEDRHVLEPQDICSIVILPIQVERKLWGFIGFDDCETERAWKEEDIRLLQTVAEIVGTAIDRKRSVEALREREERYALATSAAKVGVWDWDLRSGSFYLDPNIKALLGYEDSEIPNDIEVWTQYIHPDDKDAVMQAASDHLEGRTPTYVFEHRMLHKDGTIRWFMVRGTAIRNASGNVVRMVGTDTDITDRKQTEEALRASENRYKTLVENLPQRIFLKDKDSTYVSCNQNYARDLRIKPDEIAGKTDYEFYPKELAKKYRADDIRIVESGKIEDIEERYIQNGRDIWVHTVKTPVKDEKGNIVGVLGIFWDITERKRIDAREKARLQLLNDLRTARNIDACLEHGCKAIYEAGLFKRAVLTLHNDKKEIINLGQVGLDESVVQAARNAPGPDDELSRNMTQEKYRLSNSYFIPEENGLGLKETPRHVSQTDYVERGDSSWKVGDELFVPVIGDDNKYEGWLSVDTPFDGERPTIEIVRFLEQVVDIVTQKVREIITLEKLRQGHKALRAERDHSRRIIDGTTAIICGIAPDGKTNFINPAGERITSYSNEELVGRNWWRVFYPGEEYRQVEQLFRDFEKGDVRDYEMMLTTKDGGKRTISWSSINRFDETGKLVEIIGFGNDITERKKAAEALLESEERFRNVSASAQDAILMMDNEGRISFWNEAAERVFGYQAQDILGKPLHETLGPKRFHDAYRKGFGQFRDVGEGTVVGQTLELAAVRKDGTEFPIELSVSAIKLKGKWNAVGILRDITERKQAEEALRSERDFVRSLLDTANSLIVCLDNQARITVFNKECEKVTGYTREEVIGKSWPEVFLPEEVRHDGLENFAEWVRQHPHDMYEGPLITKSGQIRTILWSNSALSLSDSDELTAIAIGQDITERKEAERQLQVASQKRYNQVKEIAGGVSHEIFNALFPATSCLSKLSQRLNLSQTDEVARNRKLIQVIENAVQRAVEMTELVTEYSKLESDRKVEEVSLQAILREILLANESRIEELKVKVKLEISGDFLFKCYRPHVYSLFNNLMVNALDALAEVEQRNISISACKKGGRLSIEFSDSGAGIPPENIDKIFDAFFSTKPKTGTGLGLAISKKIVELYDGSIEVNSSLDKGTKFIILL